MIRDSKQVQATMLAYKKGYRVTETGEVTNPKGEKLKTCSQKGYRSFNLRFAKTQTIPIYIHKLQAYQKFGEQSFYNGIVVRHLNGNPLDNSVDNIAIGSHQDNMLDKPKDKRRLWASHPKYKHDQILKDRSLGMKFKDIMEKYNISSKGTLSFIINKSISIEKFLLEDRQQYSGSLNIGD